MRVSIVINTLNRGQSLRRTLQSLRHLDYPDFEVVVVNGPSTDDSEEVIASFAGEIKAGRCPVANLSVSRNIGIAMASGDLVAFIDDDAIPEPEWLNRIVAGYHSDGVGGVGGFVYNHTGYEFQSRYIICNRLGGARLEADLNPNAHYNFPGSYEFPSHLGTNSTFRRDLLIAVGGFDEEFEYYLDETDVCVRIVDSGHTVDFVEDAFIHHKFLPSHIRNEKRVVKNWYAIIKNNAYFSIKHALATLSLGRIVNNVESFVDSHRQGVRWAVGEGLLTAADQETFEEEAKRAVIDGVRRGLNPERKHISQETLNRYACPFKQFPRPFAGVQRLKLCFASQDFPPGHNGGIARVTFDTAHGLARRGHYVHVVTRGSGHNTVDFEEGVWVHRIVPPPDAPSEIPVELAGARSNDQYAWAVHQELLRIDSHRRIDLIEAPVWDGEAVHCLLDPRLRARTLLALQTTLKLAAEAQGWPLTDDLRRMIAAEQFVLEQAGGFKSNGAAINDALRRAYGVEVPDWCVVPHGVRDLAQQDRLAPGRADAELRLLFVGRLERRKGIDVLLEAAPGLLRAHPQLRITLVGDDRIPSPEGSTYRELFLARHAGDPILDRVEFAGRLSDEHLFRRYAECDLFVAPSRYESFGLIFLEAMMFAKPVIGCRAGGMVEVVEHEGNGLLAEPGDRDSLAWAIERLLRDPELRRRFGQRSRQLFEERFTDDRMVERSLEVYLRVLSGAAGREPLGSAPQRPSAQVGPGIPTR